MNEWSVPHRSDTVTDETIFQNARRVATDLKHTPSYEEMHDHRKYEL